MQDLKGGLYMEIILLMIILGGMVFYGVWKYAKAETNDYNQLLSKAQFLEIKIKDIEKKTEELDLQIVEAIRIAQDSQGKVVRALSDFETVKNQQSLLRDSQSDLRERLAAKRPVVKLDKVEVEIVNRTKTPRTAKDLGETKKKR